MHHEYHMNHVYFHAEGAKVDRRSTTEGRPKVDPRWSTLIWSRTATDRRSCLRTSTNLVHIYILYIYKSHQCSNFNQSINVPILISGRGATFISDDIFYFINSCRIEVGVFINSEIFEVKMSGC